MTAGRATCGWTTPSALGLLLLLAACGTAPPAPEKVYAALQDAKRRDEYVSGPFKGTWVLTHKGKTRVRELESLGVEIAA